MSAYVIVEVSIHDQKDYEEYKKLTPAAIAAFDGKFIVRGGTTTRWKETGSRNGSLCWNFLLLSGQMNGGIPNLYQSQNNQTESSENKNDHC